MCDQGLLVGLCTHDYKSECIVVTISATLVDTQTLSRLENAYSRPLFYSFLGILTSKVGQTDLVFGVCDLVGLCMHDYKSQCTVVMICVTLVDT